MGSNMAECHPVGFQWVIEARERGAKVIHVDPRFTRTSAMADLHVPLRAGSDIAFLGGIVNYILENGREFREYVQAYTNARTIVSDDFRDTEDLDGIFSGFDPRTASYERDTWQYKGMEVHASAGERETGEAEGEQAHGAHGGELDRGEPPEEDATLEDPRCVFQLLKRHYSRYTPEMVERICGVPKETFLEVAEALCENSGRERTRAFCYAVGWTQHTVGVQYIRTAAIVQLLLGNIGRPGRRHPRPARARLDPGLDRHPDPLQHPARATCRCRTRTNSRTSTSTSSATRRRPGSGATPAAYMVSLLKAWWGDAATAENDFCFDYLPRIDEDHSHYRTVADMADSKLEGYFVMGENPAVGSANSKLQRLGAGEARTGSSCATSARSRPRPSGTTSPEIESRRAEDRGDRHRGLPDAGRGPHREGRHASPTPSGSCSGTTRRSSRRTTAARSCGSCTTSAVASRQKLAGLERRRATGRSST